MNLGWRLEPSRQSRAWYRRSPGWRTALRSARSRAPGRSPEPAGPSGRSPGAPDGREKSAYQRMRHRLVHPAKPEQRRQVGNRRMAAVENADLHRLMGSHVAGQCDPHLFQRRAPGAETIRKHPLAERFAKHGCVVVDSELVAQQLPLPLRRRGGDPIHHAVGKGDVAVDPVGEDGIRHARKARHRVAGHLTVARQVVARHHGERRDSGGTARPERRENGAEHAGGTFRGAGIGPHSWILGVEDPGGGVDRVTALGHGQGDDADTRIAHRPDQGDVAGSQRREVDHRADNARPARTRLPLHHRAQPVLRRESRAHGSVGCAHSGTDDRPLAGVSPRQQIVEIHRLVGPVKVPHPDVHDPRRQPATVIVGACDPRRQDGQIPGAEPAHVISRSPMKTHGPSFRQARANARPMPRAAPMISAVLTASRVTAPSRADRNGASTPGRERGEAPYPAAPKTARPCVRSPCRPPESRRERTYPRPGVR